MFIFSLFNKVKPVLFLFFILISLQASSQNNPVKRRAECFFGVHFDFHATSNDHDIGRSLTPDMVNTYLTLVKPDFIQVDTKGHPGISSYPTKLGVAAPGFIKDPLKIFRSVTSNLGIGLYSHFSGLLDAEAIKNHPDWARINGNGQRDGSVVSLFGPYTDHYLIPQLEELSKNYQVDGIWLDGEVWAVQPDVNEYAKKAYTAATGKPADINNDYMAFTRRAFHQYLNHYTAVLHKFNPKLQIASNWAFSTFMPGPIDAGVDFLSGDIVYDDVKNMTIEPRVLSAQGKPWDLMIWGFMGDKNGQGHYWKSPLQLQQKAAIIISQGGAFQVYIGQNHDASIPLETAPAIKQVADFCYARKPYSFKAKAIPQIAMLFSGAGHDFDLGTATAFNQANGGNDNIKGTLAALLNSQYSVQVLQEHQLAGNLYKYPLLVITEWNYLTPSFVAEVQDYVGKGGKLLVIGGVSCGIFNAILPGNSPVDRNNPASLPIKRNNYGSGKVIGIDANISLQYYNTMDDNIRQTIANAASQLFTNPLVTISGSNKIHVVLNTLNQTTLIHLINVGDHWETINGNQLDFQLPPTDRLQIAFHSAKKPTQILLQPNNTPLPFNYAGGTANFSVPSVSIYSIIQVKY